MTRVHIVWPKHRGPHMHWAVFAKFGYVVACGRGRHLTRAENWVTCGHCKRATGPWDIWSVAK